MLLLVTNANFITNADFIFISKHFYSGGELALAWWQIMEEQSSPWFRDKLSIIMNKEWKMYIFIKYVNVAIYEKIYIMSSGELTPTDGKAQYWQVQIEKKGKK